MVVERCVVNNRIFLLGLDELYREAMKRHERGELFACARKVAEVLQVRPADVAIEGYYAEDSTLTAFFRLLRALQEVDEKRTDEVTSLLEFQRLHEVASAPLYGRPHDRGKLLPVGRDALSEALFDTRPAWTIKGLTAMASRIARETDEFSLVGLAACVQDPVVITAVRESVVLFAVGVALGMASDEPRREYVWKVDEDLARQARKFIETFNALFHETLPLPEPAQAERFWKGSSAKIWGRCVRLGYDDTVRPTRQYHWAITRGAGDELEVEDFWSTEVWTTGQYRAQSFKMRPGHLR